MKNYSLLSLIIGTFVFVGSGVPVKTYEYEMVAGEEPVLPTKPFTYAMEIPEELLTASNYDTEPSIIEEIANIDANKATLGRVLFYDKILSESGTISCGSCHEQSKSFADDSRFSAGVSDFTRRNSLHLNDITWAGEKNMFWDAQRIDIEEAIVLPLTDKNEIGATEKEAMISRLEGTTYYSGLFQKAYGDHKISQDRVVEALSEFIKSINTIGSRVDEFHLSGNNDLLSSEEEHGELIFRERCMICHSGLLADGFFHNGLAPDTLNWDLGAGEWAGRLYNFAFRSVNLRNVALTAPYMHDGRYKTLEQVINFYSDSIYVFNNTWPGLYQEGRLSQEQKDNLLSFLRAKTDSTILTEERWSDPFKLRSSTLTFDDKVNIKVFPNPSTGVVNIEVPESVTDNLSLRVFSYSGAQIDDIEFVHTTTWRPKQTGSYFLQVLSRGQVLGSKTIIVK